MRTPTADWGTELRVGGQSGDLHPPSSADLSSSNGRRQRPQAKAEPVAPTEGSELHPSPRTKAPPAHPLCFFPSPSPPLSPTPVLHALSLLWRWRKRGRGLGQVPFLRPGTVSSQHHSCRGAEETRHSGRWGMRVPRVPWSLLWALLQLSWRPGWLLGTWQSS